VEVLGSLQSESVFTADKIIAAGWVLLFLACSVSFLMADTTDDVKVFIGVAAMADKSTLPFPQNIDQTWEIKPIENRIFYYMIWKAPQIVNYLPAGAIEWAMPEIRTTMREGAIQMADEIWIKVFGYLCVISIMALYFYSISWFLRPEHNIILACIIGIAMLSPYNLFLLQPEWFAVLASLLSAWLLMQEHPAAQVLGGIVAALVFALKGSTAFMVPAIACATLLFTGKKDWIINMIDGLIGTIIGGAVLCLTVFPNAIPDIILSMQISGFSRSGGLIGLNPIDRFGYLMYEGIMSVSQMPVVIVGIAATIAIFLLIFFEARREGRLPDRTEILFYLIVTGMWVFSLASVALVGEFYPYHYMLLIFPSIIASIGFFILMTEFAPAKVTTAFMVVGLIVVTFCWFTTCSIWAPVYNPQHTYWQQVQNNANQINEKFKLSGQDSLLYLDTGSAPFYFRAQTACRYSSAMVIQRNMTETKAYQETMDCILGYHGKYIVSSRQGWPYFVQKDNIWIGNQQVIDWMNMNYHKIYEGRAWDVFSENNP
jgi:hypothetical protein